MSARLSALATVSAIASALAQQGYTVSFDRARARAWCEGRCVAWRKGGEVVIEAVYDGLRHSEALPGMADATHPPTSSRARIAEMVAECAARILAARAEQARLDTWKAERLAGYVCPGAACREPLCGCRSHEVPPDHVCSEDNQGLCHSCGLVLNPGRLAEYRGEVRHAA